MVTEFFFATWPDGVGALLVQFVLIVAGAAAGVRMIDDVRSWLRSRSRGRVQP